MNYQAFRLLAAALLIGNILTTSAQTITTIAGSGTAGYSGDGGAATAAELNWPTGTCADNAGNLYIMEWMNNRVRKVDAAGVITTVAGTGTAGAVGDYGAATAAQLSAPYRMAIDTFGNLYIADMGNDRIRKIDASGTITTAFGAGFGYSGDGGPASAALMGNPTDVIIDKWGNFYVTDIYNHVVRKITPSGTISTVAGTGTGGYSGDGGAATNARLFYPEGLAADTLGNLFIADRDNGRVRKVDISGVITTIAGNGTISGAPDGSPATAASVSGPTGLCFDRAGNLLIAEYTGHVIRGVDPTGNIFTAVGTTMGFSGDGGPATAAQLRQPKGVSCDNAGNLYIADWQNNRVRKVTPGPLATGRYLFTADDILIYPDPAVATITISAPASFRSLAVCDLFGRVLISQLVNAAGTSLDVGALPPGIYFARVDGIVSRRFVRQ